MDKTNSKTRNWWIVFIDSKPRLWPLRYLRKGFKHVYGITKSPGEQFWQVINPCSNAIDVDLYPCDVYPHPGGICEKGATLIPVKAKYVDKNRYAFGAFTCVEVVKGLLGIQAFKVLTPYQLYKYLEAKYE